MHAQNIEIQHFLLRKSQESFDIGIAKNLRKFQFWEKKISYEKNEYSDLIFMAEMISITIEICVYMFFYEKVFVATTETFLTFHNSSIKTFLRIT